MRSFLVVTIILGLGAAATLLVLGFFGIVDLNYIYIDIVGFTKGVNYEEYISSRSSFQIRYPKNWSIDENILTSRVDFFVDDENGRVASFVVDQVAIEADFSFDQYTQDRVKQMQDNLNSFKKLDLRETQLDDKEAIRISYSYKSSKQDFLSRRYWLVFEGNIYEVTQNVIQDQEEKFQPILDLMAESFRLLSSIQTSEK